MGRPDFFTEFVLEPDASVRAIARLPEPASCNVVAPPSKAAMPCDRGPAALPSPASNCPALLRLQLSIRLYMKNVVPIFKSVQGVSKVWVQIASGADENYLRVQKESTNGLRKKFDLAFEEVGRTRLPNSTPLPAWARLPASPLHPSRQSWLASLGPAAHLSPAGSTRAFTDGARPFLRGQVAMINAVYSHDVCPLSVTADPITFLSCLSNFPPSLAEVTLVAGADTLTYASRGPTLPASLPPLALAEHPSSLAHRPWPARRRPHRSAVSLYPLPTLSYPRSASPPPLLAFPYGQASQRPRVARPGRPKRRGDPD